MQRILTLLGCLTILLCLTACGKTAEVSAEASDAVISDPEEITFRDGKLYILFESASRRFQYGKLVGGSYNADAVTYTVCSAQENFLFYEGHGFAYVEKYTDGSWYPLVQQDSVSTGDFQWLSIPTEEVQGTISIQTEYGGRLEKGTYRLVAPCSLSADPDAADEASAVDLAAEFEIG